MASSVSASSSPPLRHVVIVGGGIVGASIAYHLTLEKKVRVTVIERNKVAGAASGKAGGFLARGWGSGPTVQLHEKSFDMHKALAKTLDIKSFRFLPTLSVAGGEGVKKGRRSDCPWLDPSGCCAKVMDPDTAQVTPFEMTTKMMSAASKQGATLVIGTVCGILEAKGARERVVGGVILEGGRRIEADDIVIAMGPWSHTCETWFPTLRVPMTGIYSSSIIIRHKPGSVEPFALFCDEDERGCHLEVYPRPEGDVYVCGCGGSRHLRGKDIDANTPEKVCADAKRVEAALSSLRKIAPRLSKAKADVTQACMRPCLDDGMPMLGRVPEVANAFIATGHNCWGILWGPITGLAMSELILEGAAKCVDLKPFSPARFQVRASRRSRKMVDQDVGETW